MEDKEEAMEGEFVWVIENFLSWDGNISPNFKFGKYDCYLEIDSIDHVDVEEGYIVYMCHSRQESINYKTSCKLCIIDGRGDEFLVTKRTTDIFCDDGFPFMTIWQRDLLRNENILLPEDVLTLRLSWSDSSSTRERDTRTASDLISKKERNKLLQTHSEHFGRFYESKDDTDFLLRVGETTIPVHCAMLSARSKVFAAIFRHDTSEKRSGGIEISDVSAVALDDALYYVYSGQIRGMSADTIIPMFVVADKYGLIELRDACLNVLMRNLTVGNVCDAAQLAETYKETKLEEKVVKFVKEKIEEIEETDKWKELLKTKFMLAVKLLRSALNICKHEVKNLSYYYQELARIYLEK